MCVCVPDRCGFLAEAFSEQLASRVLFPGSVFQQLGCTCAFACTRPVQIPRRNLLLNSLPAVSCFLVRCSSGLAVPVYLRVPVVTAFAARSVLQTLDLVMSICNFSILYYRIYEPVCGQLLA